jgi:hypothetical protein
MDALASVLGVKPRSFSELPPDLQAAIPPRRRPLLSTGCLAQINGTQGIKKKMLGMVGTILSEEEAQREFRVPPVNEVVLRLFNEGRLICTNRANLLDVTELHASLLPEPRSASQETLSDESFLEFIVTIASGLQCRFPRMQASVSELSSRLASHGLGFATKWRQMLHAAYAAAIDCYPDAEFANLVFHSRTEAGDSYHELYQAFAASMNSSEEDQKKLAPLLFDLSRAVSHRFCELNRDHQRPSKERDCWVMQDGVWTSSPTLFTRDPSNRDRPLPARTFGPEGFASSGAHFTEGSNALGATSASSSTTATLEDVFHVGAAVLVQGLVSKPHLNGQQAIIVGPLQRQRQPPRWPVRVEGGEEMLLRTESLAPRL